MAHRLLALALLITSFVNLSAAPGAIEAKASAIRLEQLEYEQMDLKAVVKDLSRKSKTYSADGRGINCMSLIRDYSQIPKVTLFARDISVLQAIKMVCLATGTNYEATGFSLNFTDTGASPATLKPGDSFSLIYTKTAKTFGPLVMKNGYRFSIGKLNFSVVMKKSSSSNFYIRSAKSGKSYGPYAMKNGQQLKIGSSVLSLKTCTSKI